MKIWMCVLHRHQEKYFSPTRKEAQECARNRVLYHLDLWKRMTVAWDPTPDPLTTADLTFDIIPLEFQPTREGICRLLNGEIDTWRGAPEDDSDEG